MKPSFSFTSVIGVPVHYARPPVADYGTTGKPYTFYSTPNLHARVQQAFREIAKEFGTPRFITCAGTYVAKPGFHGTGDAFDLDGIFWDTTSIRASDYPTNPALYLGVEACLRKFFGTVLNYEYNAAHRDHWHLDLGGKVEYDGARSKVLFRQMTAKHLGVSAEVSGSTWDDILTSTIAMAKVKLRFNREPEPEAPAKDVDPLEALHYLYEVVQVELGETETRRKVESALNSFANHPDLQAWIEQYRK